MKIDLNKMRIAMANACMNTGDLKNKALIPEGTMKNVLNGCNSRPATVGRIAKALGVPVESILMDEETEQQKKDSAEIAETLEKARLVSRYTWLSMKFMQLYRMGGLTPDQQQEMTAIKKELEELDKILESDKR